MQRDGISSLLKRAFFLALLGADFPGCFVLAYFLCVPFCSVSFLF
jgi:hypothetical protein